MLVLNLLLPWGWLRTCCKALLQFVHLPHYKHCGLILASHGRQNFLRNLQPSAGIPLSQTLFFGPEHHSQSGPR